LEAKTYFDIASFYFGLPPSHRKSNEAGSRRQDGELAALAGAPVSILYYRREHFGSDLPARAKDGTNTGKPGRAGEDGMIARNETGDDTNGILIKPTDLSQHGPEVAEV
jgi:hypothetical protein